MVILGIFIVIQCVINIGAAVIKSREQESQLRRGDHIGHVAVMKILGFRDVMQRCLGLLHRADGAENISKVLVGIISLEGIVPALEGHIVAVAAQQDHIGGIQIQILHHLLIEGHAGLGLLQLGFAKIHQKLMFLAAGHLSSGEIDLDQILSQRAPKAAAQQGKIFLRLVLRHDADALDKFGNNFLIIIDIAPIQMGHIAAIPTLTATDLTDFFGIHSSSV